VLVFGSVIAKVENRNLPPFIGGALSRNEEKKKKEKK